MYRQKVKPDDLSGKLFEDFPQQEEVTQGLGHFFMIDGNKAVMHPVPGHGLAKTALALSDFVFMVGKNQVKAAAVDIEAFSQIFIGHGGAFDMPAGTALAPGAFPGGLAGFCLFPQSKVGGIPLAAVYSHPGAVQQVFPVSLG